MSDPLTDADLDRIERHAEYGHLEGQDYDAVETLVAEVQRLRAERTAMLDALEAAQVLADLDTWSWEDRQSALREWDQRIARVRTLAGDDRE